MTLWNAFAAGAIVAGLIASYSKVLVRMVHICRIRPLNSNSGRLLLLLLWSSLDVRQVDPLRGPKAADRSSRNESAPLLADADALRSLLSSIRYHHSSSRLSSVLKTYAVESDLRRRISYNMSVRLKYRCLNAATRPRCETIHAYHAT